MKFIILSLIVGGIVALPMYATEAIVMPQLESLNQTYRSFDDVAQDVAAGTLPRNQ